MLNAEMNEINTLVAQYFQLVEPHHLNLPDGPTIVKPAIQTALYERMFNEDTVWPVPPVNYRTRVLKMIISRIEESISDPEEDEIISDLMETWSTLMTTPKPSPLQQAQQLSYIKYTAPTTTTSTVTTPRTVITSESRGLILSAGTTGFRTWEAALHLGSFLATPAGEALVRGKRVIELGAGTGFLSMFAAKYLDVQRVVVTDREEALLDSIRDSVGRNELDGGVLRPAIWEWGSPLDFEKGDDGEDGAFDVALGADLIYDTDLVPLLLSTLTTLFDTYKIKCFIISATLRNQDTFQTFLNACESSHFKAECMEFRSPAEETQTGFFHATGIPIRTYKISR